MQRRWAIHESHGGSSGRRRGNPPRRIENIAEVSGGKVSLLCHILNHLGTNSFCFQDDVEGEIVSLSSRAFCLIFEVSRVSEILSMHGIVYIVLIVIRFA